MIFAAIVMMAGFSTSVMAQDVTSTKPNAAQGSILGAIALTTVNPLSFGNIIPDAAAVGTVTMDNAEGRTFTVVTLVDGTITPTSASYTVTGTGDASYSIVIPTASFDILNTTTGVATDKMAVTAMTCSKSDLLSTFSHTGTDGFKVGGTLNVGIAQTPGKYTANFDVTVAY